MSGYEGAHHGQRRVVGPGFYARVYDLVRAVPPGSVTTYGDIAAALGRRSVARHVGYALAALPEGADVPWWRVVAAGGRLTRDPAAAERQARCLATDGVAVRGATVQDFAARRHVFDVCDGP